MKPLLIALAVLMTTVSYGQNTEYDGSTRCTAKNINIVLSKDEITSRIMFVDLIAEKDGNLAMTETKNASRDNDSDIQTVIADARVDKNTLVSVPVRSKSDLSSSIGLSAESGRVDYKIFSKNRILKSGTLESNRTCIGNEWANVLTIKMR